MWIVVEIVEDIQRGSLVMRIPVGDIRNDSVKANISFRLGERREGNRIPDLKLRNIRKGVETGKGKFLGSVIGTANRTDKNGKR